jgi:hypothetical protein
MRKKLLGFALLLALGTCGAAIETRADELWPIYPPYPYRAGHYPKADWYHDMPPYVAMKPSFYRKRYFMMAQERNRYRYMPQIFRGYADDEGIEDIDIQAVTAGLGDVYGGSDALK